MKQLGLAGVASGTSWIFMGPQGQFRTPFHQQNIMGYSNMAMRKSFRNVDDLPLPKCFFFPVAMFIERREDVMSTRLGLI
jgi:hypothetical protein